MDQKDNVVYMEWWEDNKYYLYWSDEYQLLMVDKRAKDTNKPLHKLDPEKLKLLQYYYDNYAP